MRMRSAAAAIALAACLTGCTTTGEVALDYDAPLAGTGKALLKTDSENKHSLMVLLDERVWITHLDGRELYRMGKSTDYPQAMLVDPGRHYVTAKYEHLGEDSLVGAHVYATAQLTFDAKAEGRYLIRKTVKDPKVTFWIEDVETGQRVDLTDPGAETKPWRW